MEAKMWRALIRVEHVLSSGILVIIPAWSPRETVFLPWREIPFFMKPHLSQGARFHARVNIGADRPDELHFEDWEPKPMNERAEWSEELGAFYGITEDEWCKFERLSKRTLGSLTEGDLQRFREFTARMLDHALHALAEPDE